jgi:hypothetical protein
LRARCLKLRANEFTLSHGIQSTNKFNVCYYKEKNLFPPSPPSSTQLITSISKNIIIISDKLKRITSDYSVWKYDCKNRNDTAIIFISLKCFGKLKSQVNLQKYVEDLLISVKESISVQVRGITVDATSFGRLNQFLI